MELYHYFPSVTFVALTADQFVGRDDSPIASLIPLFRARRIFLSLPGACCQANPAQGYSPAGETFETPLSLIRD